MYRKWWWKITGILLVCGSLVGGLFIPLKPDINIDGIAHLNSGDIGVIKIIGKNTHFDSLNLPQIYLKNRKKNFLTKAKKIEVTENGLNASFYIPAVTDTFEVNLICADKINGYMEVDGAAVAFPTLGIDSNPKAVETFDTSILYYKAAGTFFPSRVVLNESIRNLIFHVPMWFAMIFLLGLSFFYSIKFLNASSNESIELDELFVQKKNEYQLKAYYTTVAGVIAGILGCITGSMWARATWGSYWPYDPKLIGVAVGMLIYFAYFFLRANINDPSKKDRISAVYSVFVYPIFISLIVIMPKIAAQSLHPGSGDTVAVKDYDLDNTMRMFFYPAVIGWIFIYLWIAEIMFRLRKLDIKKS